MNRLLKTLFAVCLLSTGLCHAQDEEANRENETQSCQKYVSPSNRFHLILYYRPDCPYCNRVTKFLEAEGKADSINMRNTFNPRYQRELLRVGGKSQVPCLLIDGEPMYESKDILNWLKNHRDEY